MKNKLKVLVSAFLISLVSFAQKDQIKAAEKSLKGGNSQEAITILQSTETVIANATDGEKAQFYFIKGNALMDQATKKVEEIKNLTSAAKSYSDLLGIEKKSGKDKFSAQAQASIEEIKGKLVNFAIDKQAESKFKEASELLFQVYELDKKDLNKLYFAATYAKYDKQYDTALTYYTELKKQNFTGEETQYFAKNVISDKEDYFGSTAEAKSNRDAKVKLKIYTNPRDEVIPSKLGDINKSIAFILTEQGKTDLAKKAFEEAILQTPDDVSLIIAQLELYFKENDMVTYKKLIASALEKNPNNADLIFNLAVVTNNNKDLVEAEKLYKQAISLNPNSVSAYLNLANLKLESRNKIVDDMNKLGTSVLDTKKYNFLKKQSEEILNTDVLPLLEKANQIEPANDDVKSLLIKIYGALDLTDKIKSLKAE
jgi:tetratricopeptide (TPR) repeat protein